MKLLKIQAGRSFGEAQVYISLPCSIKTQASSGQDLGAAPGQMSGVFNAVDQRAAMPSATIAPMRSAGNSFRASVTGDTRTRPEV
jgi:hypothetical protein